MVPSGTLLAWITIGTGAALLMVTSGIWKLPVGFGLTGKPLTLTTLIFGVVAGCLTKVLNGVPEVTGTLIEPPNSCW